MRDVRTAVERRARREEHGGTAVDAHVLRHLIIDALKERAVCAEDRARSAACESRRHCDGVLLRDADVDVLCAERRAVFGGETNAADDARREIDEVRIFPCRPQDEIDGRGVVCARRFG